MKITRTLLTAAALVTIANPANADLVSALGGQVVTDTDLNITWVANANLAATNTFGLATFVNLGTDAYGYESKIFPNGAMTWGGAQKWIGAMNAANYLGYSDWRLPTTSDTGAPGIQVSYNGTDGGYNNPATSELSHLFYTELGNKGIYSTTRIFQSDYGLVNTGPFTNFQANGYWSGTEYAPDAKNAWFFATRFGNQDISSKTNFMYALAVRSGNVAAPVPEPETYALLLAGLGLMGGIARRRKSGQA